MHVRRTSGRALQTPRWLLPSYTTYCFPTGYGGFFLKACLRGPLKCITWTFMCIKSELFDGNLVIFRESGGSQLSTWWGGQRQERRSIQDVFVNLNIFKRHVLELVAQGCVVLNTFMGNGGGFNELIQINCCLILLFSIDVLCPQKNALIHQICEQTHLKIFI